MMSYSVEYAPELRDSYPSEYKNTKKLIMKSMAIIISGATLLYVLNAAKLLHWVIPGDSAITAGAFSDAVESVRVGQSVSDAVFTFFRDVIIGGIS